MENETLRIGLFILILIFGFCIFITLENFRFYKKTGKMRKRLGRSSTGKWGQSYGKAQGTRAWYWNMVEIIFYGFMIVILSLALLAS